MGLCAWHCTQAFFSLACLHATYRTITKYWFSFYDFPRLKRAFFGAVGTTRMFSVVRDLVLVQNSELLRHPRCDHPAMFILNWDYVAANLKTMDP